MKQLATVLSILLLPLVAMAQPTTAVEALQANIDATGGTQAWTAVNSMVTKGSRQMDMAGTKMSGTFEDYQQFPGLSRMVMETQSAMGSMKQETLQTPDGAWNFVRGTWSDREDSDVLRAHGPKTELTLLSHPDVEITSFESGEPSGTPVWIVNFSFDGEDYSRHYRQSDNLVVASRRADRWSYFDDHREVEGLTIPHEVTSEAIARMNRNGDVQEVSITVISTTENISINEELAPELFTRGSGPAK